MPKFSVIIPLYNKEKYIKRTIKSVLNQTFTDYELLVIDDGSTDNSIEVVNKFDSTKINLLQKSNGGESSARNYGIKAAKGKFLCFLDADDTYLDNHFEILNKLIEIYPTEVFFSTNFFIKFPGSDEKSLAIDNYEDKGIIVDYFLESITNPLVTSNTACIKSDIFSKVDLFSEDLRFGPDLEMWFRIALNYKLVFSNIPTAIYYKDAENRVMSNYNNFNDAIIIKMNTNLEHIGNHKSASLYIEANIIKQVKFHLTKGNNKLVRSKLEKFKSNFNDIRKFYFFKVLTYLPISRILKIKGAYST